MTYIFKGRICGLICSECPEPLADMVVRLYRARAEQDITALAVADPKETFAILSEEQAAARSAGLIAEARTDADGGFSFELGEQSGYNGEAFEIDLYCGTVPHRRPTPTPPQPLQITITTLQPRWRQSEAGSIAAWEYCIPERFWCAVRARFGAWTICGRLTTCKDRLPIAGATVRAFDVDWLQDDPLGAAVTGADGRFRIDYLAADFQRTPLSPWINLEWVGGPDVYFTVEYGGSPVFAEPPATGRTPGRQNIGPCFCVELCTDAVPHTPPDGGVEQTPHWQKVWDFNVHPHAPNPASAFSTEGYAGAPGDSFVFGGAIRLRGNCPLRNAAAPANALEYRFLIGEWTWTGGGDGDPTTLPTNPPAALAPVTQIFGTEVGWVFYNDGVDPFASASVIIGPGDVGADGWIKVDGKSVTVPMSGGGTSTVSVTPSNFLRSDHLLELNSLAISAAHPVRLPGGLPKSDAGRALTTAEQEPIRRYSLRFEARDSVTHLPVAGDTLAAIVIDNSEVKLALDLEELRTNACAPVGSEVHILYTIDHPHLRSFSLAIANNNGGVHPPPALPSGAFAAPPPQSNFFFRGGNGGPHQPLNNGGFVVDVSGDPPCAYRVILSWQTRRYFDTGHSTEILYCK